eukprot:373078_1
MSGPSSQRTVQVEGGRPSSYEEELLALQRQLSDPVDDSEYFMSDKPRKVRFPASMLSKPMMCARNGACRGIMPPAFRIPWNPKFSRYQQETDRFFEACRRWFASNDSGWNFPPGFQRVKYFDLFYVGRFCSPDDSRFWLLQAWEKPCCSLR